MNDSANGPHPPPANPEEAMHLAGTGTDTDAARGGPPGVSRRRLLGGLGAAAALSAVGFIPIANRNRTQARAQASSSGPGRQWAAVIDLRKCEGCVTIDKPPQCTEACQEDHGLAPGQTWIKVFEQPLPGGHYFFMPRPCMHCENAPCLNVCPVDATYRDETGNILVDQDRCIGCRLCMAACPYGARYFHWGDPPAPPPRPSAP